MFATVIALQGELGSGKTHFAQAFGKVLGIIENMPSPTFVIMRSYDIDPTKAGHVGAGFKKLIHIDAYRLEKEEELLHLGWNELIKSPENLILIEWPERVEGLIPKDAKRILFKHEK
ncbi:MAG: tRNA (adenosine(37)-N6)-threonylcarbamoyltransferase complex ATPase subunit type 1 TsaE [bacterium]|nr:tRNA (adenosine(37)-N6)-threonylcarbamoyltransferase complex ATPase subunit type 1 TsaE [bacterium]